MSEANKSNREPRMPKVWESCITLAALIGVLAIGIVIFGAAVHVPMFVGVCVAALMALYLGHKWDSIEKMMMDGIYKALQSICILIIVGILIGVWINAGVVPTMIYYGLKIMHPAIFFIAAVLICSITSLATGTSWGTFSILLPIVIPVFSGGTPAVDLTVGDLNNNLLMISIAATLGGAVMGDHCSPISDTTIMASSGAQCYHLNHVATQLPYAMTVAVVCFANYILASFIQNVVINLAIAIVCMVVVLLVIGKLNHSMNRHSQRD